MTEPSFFRGRRCLVAGGTGFVGQHFVQALLAAGAQVCTTVHRRPPPTHPPRLETVAADLASREACLAAVEGREIVIHAAGAVGAAGVAGDDALLGIGTQLTLTANLLWAARRAGVARLLLFGSSTGYPAADHPVREDEFWDGPVHPAYHGYGWMRRYLERLAEFAATGSGLHVTIVRPGAIYGPHDNFDPATGHVIPALIRRAEARENPFTVWGRGDEVRDFLHAADLAAGSLQALARGASCDPVNIASGEAVTVRTLVTQVLAACGHRDADVRFDPGRPSTIPVRRIDTGKASRELGFRPRFTLAEGLADTVRWYRRSQAADDRSAP